MKNLKFYKTNISLPDFILQSNLGFVVDPASTNHNVRLCRYQLDKNGDRIPKKGKGFEKEFSWVFKKKPDGIEIYFDFVTDDVVGEKKHHTIIDFVHEHLFNNHPSASVDWERLRSHLDAYLESDKFISPGESDFNLKKYSKSASVTDRIFDNVLKPPSDINFNFLKHRSIPKEIFLLDMFSKSYGVHEKTVMINNAPKMIRNHAFYHKNAEGKVVAVQDCYIKNGKTEKLYSGERGAGIWITDFNNTDNERKVMIHGESGIDMISHYAINANRLRSSSVTYTAYGGQIAFEQLKTSQLRMNKLGIKDSVFAFDNDKAGKKYTILCALNFSIDLNNKKVQPISVSIKNDVLTISSNDDEGKKFLVELNSKLSNNIEVLKAVSNNPDIKEMFTSHRSEKTLMLPSDDVFVYKVLLPMVSLENEKGMGFSAHRSVQEDWNQQLVYNKNEYQRLTEANEKGKNFS